MTYDSSAKQEVTKEFLVDIIEVMSAVDEEYTLQITDEYLKLALESKTGNKK